MHKGFVATHALGHILHIYYAHLASVRFEHSVSWVTYDHTHIYIYIYAQGLCGNSCSWAYIAYILRSPCFCEI